MWCKGREAVGTTCWWAWAGLGPEASKLDGRFQNSACQHQCFYSRKSSPNACCQCPDLQDELLLPPASVGDSKISRWVWPRLLSNYCFFPGPQFVRFSVLALRVESHFPQTSGTPAISPLVFKVKCSGSSSSWCKIPELGDPMWSLDPLLLTENLGNYSPIYALSIWGYRSSLYPVYVPLAHLIWAPFFNL